MIDLEPNERELAWLTRRRAVAEAAEWDGLLRYLRRRIAEVASSDNPSMKRYVDRSAIALEIALATGRSEGQVQSLLCVAETIESQTPLTWRTFKNGLIDASRIRLIAATVDKLVHASSVEKLDRDVIDYAVEHTVAELKRWLTRFVRRVETDEAIERAENERGKRYVRIDHVEDGMSYLTAYLPSMMAAAIERRLHHDARSLDTDGRTLEHKRADLLVSWATSNEAGQPAPRTDIAVIVPADVVAGATRGFADSADDAWAVPATWIRDLVEAGNTFWWRMLADPVGNDILTVEYQGRYAPDLLRRALLFRDHVCSYPGCVVPAWACDIDHVRPWPHGPTSAANTEPKSRRHHAQKGHGCAIPPKITAHDITPEEFSLNEYLDVRLVAA